MDNGNHRDLIIAGSGSSGGGSFRHIRIDGFGKILSDVECEEFQSNGRSEVRGHTRGEKVEVNGSSKLYGNLDAGVLEVKGDAKVEGHVTYREFNGKGSMVVKGNMTGDSFELEGGLQVDGDCAAETFVANGGFQVGGLLNAGVIDITMFWACKAQEIGGEKIIVRKSGLASLWNPFLPKFASKHLNAETIEGDEIYLEHTTAHTVRGNRVTLGPGCEVSLVEYKQHFEADKSAKVKESRQM
ncbi:hypothetical protein DVH26_33715 [Paenibacillus sp. H1-7]|uniref:hypothetical protein n=1 Tax=Paenibacillus sp. H1-7 TaxID=2282849 RepID=UPI001EF75E0B|nr:hypothetical protein [Paenibacillus sp. H1-7]ULL18958.1 hypothetical protein DVH26_33715 [Paenibacillus sp. H1-7]